MHPKGRLEHHQWHASIMDWRGSLSRAWWSTDLVYVLWRKLLLSTALLVGSSALMYLALETKLTRQIISERHTELNRTTEPTISQALWTLNESLLTSIVNGLVQDASITGARIRSTDGVMEFRGGLLTDSQTGWRTWLSDRYVSQWPITWKSNRGDELLGFLDLETSESVIRNKLLERTLLILLFSTVAFLSIFSVSFILIRAHVVRPIAMLTRLIDRYELGEQRKTIEFAQRPVGEIGRLYDSFLELEERLRVAHQRLTTAADEMARQLDEQASELSKMHQYNLTHTVRAAQQAERGRLMREVHDGFGSELTCARIAVERGTMSQSEIAVLLSRCIDDLHLIISVTSDRFARLEDAIADWRYRVSRHLAGEDFKLIWEVSLEDTPEIEQRAVLQILRIAQEAVSNAARHSGATQIRIKAYHVDRAIILEISDNGRGFSVDPALDASNRGRGLASMKVRAREIGAKLTITLNGGCTVELVYVSDASRDASRADAYVVV